MIEEQSYTMEEALALEEAHDRAFAAMVMNAHTGRSRGFQYHDRAYLSFAQILAEVNLEESL